LFLYRFSAAQIVKRSVVETYSHSVHDHSLGNVNKSVLLGGNEKHCGIINIDETHERL
jgi:hypothetical protein